jgi:hypothetical protein
MAKNSIRRALTTILSPEPTKKEFDAMREYFEFCCAYCGENIDRNSRKGHNDHINPKESNHISNRVLSCGKCNGDEKRERDWEQFLREKSESDEIFNKRKEKIDSWIKKYEGTEKTKIDHTLLESTILEVHKSFDKAVSKLRDSRK